jgi:hypothetical protein
MKNSNESIMNRSRDLPVYSAVPQPLRHRVPPEEYITQFDMPCVFSVRKYRSSTTV